MVLLRMFVLCGCFVAAFFSTQAGSQERRPKVRISNAGFTITALPLLAAKRLGRV